MQFAVISTGGKQYKVAKGNLLYVEKLDLDHGHEFDFDQVLLVADDADKAGTDIADIKVGTPLVAGAKVRAKVLEQGRSKKKIVFKFSSKTRYKKKKGHRQPFTKVEILDITA